MITKILTELDRARIKEKLDCVHTLTFEELQSLIVEALNLLTNTKWTDDDFIATIEEENKEGHSGVLLDKAVHDHVFLSAVNRMVARWFVPKSLLF
jgi:hypothetical protein